MRIMFGLFKKESQLIDFPSISLFNTETKSAEVFTPLSKNDVKIYSCGPTVYDYAHIGNLRAYVFADTLKRVLIYNGYTVHHTINLTDFGHLTSDGDEGDDKMMKGLKREGMEITLESMRLLSDRYIFAFENDLQELNILFPSQFSRASDYVQEQIALIKTLEEKGYTYKTSDGVYFDITKFPTYGRLGNIDLQGLQSGARVAVNTEKRNPFDFAVWKNGELGWESAWGKGFPGWHIECSAMAFATLGKQIDIHTGGVDNIATHHNGEIAQCESATGKQFSRYWMHSEHIQIDNQKIAKSDGNGIILKDLIEKGFSGEDYRYWLLTSHYRSKANFSLEALGASKQALMRLKKLLFIEWENERGKINTRYQQQFVNIINNDLNTAQAIALIWDIVKDETLTKGERKSTIIEFDAVLGLGLSKKKADILHTLGTIAQDELPEQVLQYLEEREGARIARNWNEADRLREAILLLGYEIEDGPQGPKVTKTQNT
jgi:cysteinyl-tRNA synthetase